MVRASWRVLKYILRRIFRMLSKWDFSATQFSLTPTRPSSITTCKVIFYSSDSCSSVLRSLLGRKQPSPAPASNFTSSHEARTDPLLACSTLRAMLNQRPANPTPPPPPPPPVQTAWPSLSSSSSSSSQQQQHPLPKVSTNRLKALLHQPPANDSAASSSSASASLSAVAAHVNDSPLPINNNNNSKKRGPMPLPLSSASSQSPRKNAEARNGDCLRDILIRTERKQREEAAAKAAEATKAVKAAEAAIAVNAANPSPQISPQISPESDDSRKSEADRKRPSDLNSEILQMLKRRKKTTSPSPPTNRTMPAALRPTGTSTAKPLVQEKKNPEIKTETTTPEKMNPSKGSNGNGNASSSSSSLSQYPEKDVDAGDAHGTNPHHPLLYSILQEQNTKKKMLEVSKREEEEESSLVHQQLEMARLRPGSFFDQVSIFCIHLLCP